MLQVTQITSEKGKTPKQLPKFSNSKHIRNNLTSPFVVFTSFGMNFGISTSPALAIVAQDRLLRHFLKKVNFEVKSSPEHDLNYVVFKPKHANNKVDDIYRKPVPFQKPRTLILTHGFGSGLGFFYSNYDALSHQFDRIIAVDWLGMGCSSRVSKRVTKLTSCCKTTGEHKKEVAQLVADEFIDSLEELRIHEGIDEFVLAGHSLGGFLSAKYAIKYPSHVKALVLISPVGVPEAPPVEEHLPDRELNWQLRWIKKLWGWNVTPQSLVRVAGYKGPDLVAGAISRRFAPDQWKNPLELKLIADYMYHITAAPANGEYSLNALLQPVIVKSPVVPAAEETTSQQLNPNNTSDTSPTPRRSRRNNGASASVYARLPVEKELAQLKMPILLLYGDHDWLYYPTAPESVALWKKQGIDAELKIISNAGHHLYMDNADEFNESIGQWINRVA